MSTFAEKYFIFGSQSLVFIIFLSRRRTAQIYFVRTSRANKRYKFKWLFYNVWLRPLSATNALCVWIIVRIVALCFGAVIYWCILTFTYRIIIYWQQRAHFCRRGECRWIFGQIYNYCFVAHMKIINVCLHGEV